MRFESDMRYFSRRASAEMQAASRALTSEARDRRIRLAESYLSKLEALRR